MEGYFVFKGILFVCAAVVAVFFFSVNVFAVDILFEYRQRRQVSRGVEYELNRMMTGRGMLDVHVLWVDLNESFVTFAPVISTRELGRRETTSRLLSDAGAVAGINADFFGMTGSHTVHFGPMVREGELLGINAGVNYYGAGELFGTFMLDMNNNPFFMYLRADICVYINGVRTVYAGTYNTIGAQMWSPMIVDRLAMYDTAYLDARLENLIKIIVEHNIITRISTPGETVTVPENGFLIILPPRMNTYYYMNRFRVGDVAAFRAGASFRDDYAQRIDFSRIQAAIGGGGMILSHGQTITGDGGAATWGRAPRSVIGQTRDGRIILMAVDGRSFSVGVTHAEMAALLLHYNVYHAMHLDGGGSTTMVTRDRGGVYSVMNRPSDGAQRPVINALGIFDNSPIGPIDRISLEPMESRAILGVPLDVNVFAEDVWQNRVPHVFHPDALIFTSPGASGFWYGGRYTPLATGLHLLEASYGLFRATATIYVYALAELRSYVSSVNLLENARVNLRFSGIATDGTRVPVPAVTGLTVSPPYLGFFYGNYFIASSGGTGYIAAAVGAVRQYIPVTVGGFPWPMDMLASDLAFRSYPREYISGAVHIGMATGRGIPRLDYSVSASERSQAAYMTFYPPLVIPGERPIALRINVMGDGSGHWIRGRVRDGDGVFHNIDFTRNADFVGWQTVTAAIPAGAPAPFTLDRIWMVTLGAEAASVHSVMFDNMEALFAPTAPAHVPQGTVFTDRQRATPGFIGAANPIEFGIPVEPTAYSALRWGDFALVNLSAAGGGIASADISQWGRFMADIRGINPRYVVILLDANPRNFAQPMEYELFHAAMSQLRGEGREIFVISSTGDTTVFNKRDGIRYIDAARPYEGIPTIRFWTCGERIIWSD
ncbi:MAG: phosphodiester glycosidase family protein [Defluviitaleaceae bacterium]|nr:phosphodiester glycosidase family protein [Defluviitaleaceae bacterium]